MSTKEYGQEYFELVQENEVIHDKAFKTKQLTYFQDAMIRFTKNKYNLTATFILLFMILLSIFVPIITPARLYLETNSAITTLPPRVPILEYFGILDGTKVFKNQAVDLATIDPENPELNGLPIGFGEEYIKPGSLKYSYLVGSTLNEKYVGGTNILTIMYDKVAYSIRTNDQVVLHTNYLISADIVSISEGARLEVYLSPSTLPSAIGSWNNIPKLGTITADGVQTIDPMEVVADGATGYLIFRLVIDQAATDTSNKIEFNSISIMDGATVDTLYEGFDLASFQLFSLNTTENGFYNRLNAKMLVATFVYDVYAAIFADKPRTIGKTDYDQILLDNPGMAESITLDENDPNAWTFGPGYPIAAVTSQSSITIAGITYTNYYVLMDGAYATGFDSNPYFLFGTDSFGHDLFTLIWLGLRTSLLLGFLAAAFNIVIGVIWGSISAYYGGQTDILMERFLDIWGSFPQITMISIITILMGPGFWALWVFLVYDGWLGAASITRIQFYRYKGREYVLAARTFGASDMRIIFKHILPNALGTIVTRVILSIPAVIFTEVNLSFLGFGIGNGQNVSLGPINLTGTSIGVILSDGQQQIMSGNTWLVIFPTIIVSILMISFNMFGNALRDALNPQLRGN